MERVSFSLSASFAMVQVQRHECRPKKCFGKCEEGDPKVCRYGYPRERCDEKEDERLSPYIPLWLLATGARCPATCVWDATRVSLYSNLENTTIHHSTCPKIWQDAYLSKAGACMNIQRGGTIRVLRGADLLRISPFF
jgi:hypothetical protein